MIAPEMKFVSDMTVSSALSLHPKARWVFAAYHLGGCSTCGLADSETLDEVARVYRLPLDQFLRDLNSLVAPS